MDGWSAPKRAPPAVYIVLAAEEGGMSPSRYKKKTCHGHQTLTMATMQTRGYSPFARLS